MSAPWRSAFGAAAEKRAATQSPTAPYPYIAGCFDAAVAGALESLEAAVRSLPADHPARRHVDEAVGRLSPIKGVS
jgi:hypothetical protein